MRKTSAAGSDLRPLSLRASGSPCPEIDHRDGLRSASPRAPATEGPPPAWRPPDLAGIEEFLQLLARGVRQYHTYPATSPLCMEAVEACHRVLGAREGRDQLHLRVAPRELLVDDVGVGAGTAIETELAARLHRAGVSALIVERATTSRELSRFCSDLASVDRAGAGESTLAEVLIEHGVEKITLRTAHRPEVFDVAPPAPAARDLIERERRRRESLDAAGPAAHLYPADKGWVRLDPRAGIGAVSLVDLAILVDDPRDLASALLRLTDDEKAVPSGETAIERKFGDVATLFGALDPRLAGVMFARLARAVLDLEPSRREALLRRTILPGLLDGRVEGSVLRDFPDVNLAESLCLLLDLETAAPEVLSAALDRMDLPAERRRALVPILEARAEARGRAAGAPQPHGQDAGLDRYVRRRLQVDAAAGRRFAEFAAFDLSIDEQTTALLAGIRDNVQAGDPRGAELQCLSNLVRLEPHPGTVGRLLARALALVADLERASRWHDVASWLHRQWEMAAALRRARPDVADTITTALDAYCTPERAARLVEWHEEGGDRRALAGTIAAACRGGLASACLALAGNVAFQPRARALADFMCEHACALGPVLAERLSEADHGAARTILKVLGFAGPGYERAIAAQCDRGDEACVREALKALTRIGTETAAALVAARVRDGDAAVRGAAEEALWHLPPARAHEQVRELLGHLDFVVRYPNAAARLLDRAASGGAAGLGPAVAAIAPLRFRFWNPGLVRVGLKAQELARR